jgi:hypothetical protein
MVEQTKEAITHLNKLPMNAKNLIDSNDAYMTKLEDSSFRFDPNAVKIDLYNFKVTKGMYRLRINVGTTLETEGFKVNEYTTKIDYTPSEKVLKQTGFEEIAKLVHNTGGMLSDYYEEAINKYDFFSDAYHKLGYERMEELNFVVTNIKRETLKYSNASDMSKVIKHIQTKRGFQNGLFVTSKEAKKAVENAHNDIGIDKKPNIKDYFEVKDALKKDNGKVVRGYYIVLPKAIAK